MKPGKEENTVKRIDEPKCMREPAELYANRYSVTNFINAYYQIRDCMVYKPANVLLIGVGTGIDSIILEHKFNLTVKTLDIDAGFKPDFVGSVHELSQFENQEFDVVIVSHVLEHLAFTYFDESLRQLSRVAKHAVLYLPYGGRHVEFKLRGLAKFINIHWLFNFKPKKHIDGISQVLCDNEHYWECGYKGFDIKNLKKKMSKYFVIDRCYQNKDWSYSLNFNLTAR